MGNPTPKNYTTRLQGFCIRVIAKIKESCNFSIRLPHYCQNVYQENQLLHIFPTTNYTPKCLLCSASLRSQRERLTSQVSSKAVWEDIENKLQNVESRKLPRFSSWCYAQSMPWITLALATHFEGQKMISYTQQREELRANQIKPRLEWLIKPSEQALFPCYWIYRCLTSCSKKKKKRDSVQAKKKIKKS